MFKKGDLVIRKVGARDNPWRTYTQRAGLSPDAILVVSWVDKNYDIQLDPPIGPLGYVWMGDFFEKIVVKNLPLKDWC